MLGDQENGLPITDDTIEKQNNPEAESQTEKESPPPLEPREIPAIQISGTEEEISEEDEGGVDIGLS